MKRKGSLAVHPTVDRVWRLTPVVVGWPLATLLLLAFTVGVTTAATVTVAPVKPSGNATKRPVNAGGDRPRQLSQTPSFARFMQQGNQMMLNGRTAPANWAQWQGPTGTPRIGITDAGLLQTMGVELLNTTDATRQPVQWFSDPVATPLPLPTRRTGPLRYLDITDFAQQMGWQLQANGATLQVTTPPATVTAIRQGKQPWGDRLVIELDRPASWQVDLQGQSVLLTVDAQIPAERLQAFKPSPGNRLQSLMVEPGTNQTRLRLGLTSAIQPRVWSLPNPNRLIIDIRPDSAIDRDILWAPGLQWRSQTLTVGANRFPIVWLAVNPKQAGIQVKPILPNPGTLTGTAPLARTAQQAQAAGAINGGFFNRNNQLPLGAIRLDGRWLAGPILGRGAIAWNAAGEVYIDRLVLQETITTPQGRLPLTELNSAYVRAGIARYTSDWGPTYTPFTDGEILVSVQNNRVIGQSVAGPAGIQPIVIPANGYLLVIRANQAAAATLTVGTSLQLTAVVSPPAFDRYPQIVAAGPLLVQNRQIVLDAKAEQFSPAFVAEKANRSAIGQTAEGTLLIVAVHDNVNGDGASLADIAQIMQQLGAVSALNLDGGSSTTLYLGGQLLDRSPRTAARVYDGIGVFVAPGP